MFFFTVWMLVAALVLAACSTAQPSPTAAPAAAQGGNAPGQGQNRGGNVNLTSEEKLAPGTLKLEGGSTAVSADQAKKLLPLWQQIQTLSADSNTTSDQLQTVYTQIESAMTADQMKAIDALTMADLQAEMQTLGIQSQGGFNGGNGGGNGNGNGNGGNNQTQDQRATQTAGTPNPNGTPGANPRFQGTPDPNRTPGAGFNGRRGFGMGNLFVEPLIQLLQKRAG
jgi:hypothetical protein